MPEKKSEPVLQKKSDFLFVEHWQDGKRPLNWFKEWETLRLSVEQLSIIERWGAYDNVLTSDKAKIFTPSETSSTSKERLENYRGRISPLSNIAWDGTTSKAISAKCMSADGNRAIRIIKDGCSTYNGKQFDRVLVDIKPTNEHQIGLLMHFDKELTKYENGDEYIAIECYVLKDLFDQMVHKLSALGPDDSVQIYIRIHCFQSEMERSLAETHHYQEYSIEEGGTAHAFINGLTIIHDVTGHSLKRTDAIEDSESDTLALQGSEPTTLRADRKAVNKTFEKLWIFLGIIVFLLTAMLLL